MARPSLTPTAAASILGKIRSAAAISDWGPFIPQSLQSALTGTRRALLRGDEARTWWSRGRIWLSSGTLKDLQLLIQWLTHEDALHLWTRPIGMLVYRTAHTAFYSDTSYAGLGGWSPHAKLFWRIMRDDLVLLGFPMKAIDNYQQEPLDGAAVGLHINPLEFVAAIVNVWLTIIWCRSRPIFPSGFIVDIWSDNTSALAWLRLCATTCDPRFQPLARLASALLVYAGIHLTKLQFHHIAGRLNIEADALSRLHKTTGTTPSLACVTAQCSQLATCQVCPLPRKLLLTLANLLSSKNRGDT
jgi:hypothetical protein